MIRDLRDAFLSLGGATLMVALAGMALDNPLILNIGLKATGATLLAYALAGLGLFVANVVAVVQTVRKAVAK